MSVPTDLNSEIALAEGWTWVEELYIQIKPIATPHYGRWLDEDLIEKETTHWLSPDGKPAMCPNYVGTTEGIAMMLQKLHYWHMYWVAVADTWHMLTTPREKVTRHGAGAWICKRYRDGIGVADDFFTSPFEKPGHCVGEAYLAKLRKEATGAKD